MTTKKRNLSSKQTNFHIHFINMGNKLITTIYCYKIKCKQKLVKCVPVYA